MIKESTRTIYNFLGETFWTQRQCQTCSISFTPTDYQTQNYQLFFQRVLKVVLTIKKNDQKKKTPPTNRNY